MTRWTVAAAVLLTTLGMLGCKSEKAKPQLADANGDLAQRAAKFAGATFSATYELSGASSIDGTLTWYQQPGKARGDFAGMNGGQAIDVIVIPGPDYPTDALLYACPTAGERCYESRPQSEQAAYPYGEFPVVLGGQLTSAAELIEGVTVTEASKRTVAGEAVQCYDTRVASDQIVSGEVCATEDGIVLSLRQQKSDGTLSFEATAFTREVSADVFELPYPLQPG